MYYVIYEDQNILLKITVYDDLLKKFNYEKT